MLFSHRTGVTYIEHAKVVSSDGQLSFVRARDAVEQHWSLPHANMCVLLLGPGTSLTAQAAYKLAEEGVLVGFTSGGATPLWYASQSEYRPTEFCQKWVTNWQDPSWRLKIAIELARVRCNNVENVYKKEGLLNSTVEKSLLSFRTSLSNIGSTQELLGYEAAFAKSLYKYHADRVGLKTFLRKPGESDNDVNHCIDNGNYLAYGLAASVLWVLGIPHAFPVTHGHTRKGALVFDLADTIKDSIVLPRAFDTALDPNFNMSKFRNSCIAGFDRHKTLQLLFATVENALE